MDSISSLFKMGKLNSLGETVHCDGPSWLEGDYYQV